MYLIVITSHSFSASSFFTRWSGSFCINQNNDQKAKHFSISVYIHYICMYACMLEKEMATHSSTLAWRIPWTEEPGRLQSKGRKESDMTEQVLLLCFLHMYVSFYLQDPYLCKRKTNTAVHGDKVLNEGDFCVRKHP